MKLRLKGNTIRIRVDRRDLDLLVNEGQVVGEIRFGDEAGQRFSYVLEIGGASEALPNVDYRDGRFLIQIGGAAAKDWRQNDKVGFETTCERGGNTIRLIVEKDFACLDRPAGQEADDQFAFPNPSSHC